MHLKLKSIKFTQNFFDELGEDCPVRQEISVLAAIAAVVQWYFSIRDPSQKGVVARSHNECLTLIYSITGRGSMEIVSTVYSGMHSMQPGEVI